MGVQRLLVAVAAMAVAACSPATTEPAPTTSKPQLEPLQVAGEASWSVPKGLSDVDVRDGLVLAGNDENLALLDAATGTPRWQLTEAEQLPASIWWRAEDKTAGLVAHDGGLAVLTTYGGTGEQGVVLLSAEDASVLWKAPLPPNFDLYVVDDRLAMITVAEGTTAALDVGTGRQLWTRADVYPVSVVDDVVLTHAHVRPPRLPGMGDLGPGAVIALDAATGAPRWDLDFSLSEVVATSDDTVLVRARAENREIVGKVLDVRDGRELADVGMSDNTAPCVFDDALAACPTNDGVVITDLVTGEVQKTGVRAQVDLVRDGRVFVSDTDRAWTIDAAGTEVDARLPGRPVAVTTGQIYVKPLTGAPNGMSVSRHTMS